VKYDITGILALSLSLSVLHPFSGVVHSPVSISVSVDLDTQGVGIRNATSVPLFIRAVSLMGSATMQVPHLGGIEVGYEFARAYDANKPTCVLINAFSMTAALYYDQFHDPELASAVNLLAVEPLGHGNTRTTASHWTFWDSATTINQLLDTLKIDQCFILGTSQGGWIATRAVLMAPERVSFLLLGSNTSLFFSNLNSTSV
jgi:microsomal epoxide hydrolase